MVNEEVMHMSAQLHVFIRHATEDWCRITHESDSQRLQHLPEPSSTHRCECSRAPKWGAQRPCGRSAKNRLNTDINTAINSLFLRVWTLDLQPCPRDSNNCGTTTVFCTVMTRTLSAQQRPLSTTLSWNWTPRGSTAGTSTTLSTYCNCGNSQFSAQPRPRTCRWTRTGTSNPRKALVGTQKYSPQFALWVHVTAAHQRLKHSVDELDLRHHPHVQRGLLELDLHGRKDVHNRRKRPTTKRCRLSSRQARRLPATACHRLLLLDGVHAQLRPTLALAPRSQTPRPPPSEKALSVMRRSRVRQLGAVDNVTILTSIVLYLSLSVSVSVWR